MRARIVVSAVAPSFAAAAQAGPIGVRLGKERWMSVPWLRWPPATARPAQPYDANPTSWSDSSCRKLRESGVGFVRAFIPSRPLMIDLRYRSPVNEGIAAMMGLDAGVKR